MRMAFRPLRGPERTLACMHRAQGLGLYLNVHMVFRRLLGPLLGYKAFKHTGKAHGV
jgi:succinate dehydrogenase/fumarate reductase cytochrome b subunit